jgi:peptidoglycan/LPS O-acetylase OafA/YrhL
VRSLEGSERAPAQAPAAAQENNVSFRFDINALRALSVVAVVGYHYQIVGFTGGFVGVDIFLAITGYLMTGKVLQGLALDRFSLLEFGAMRMRRIYPALAVTIFATVVAGWFLTLPGEYLKHLLQALSALTFVSNFAFDSDNGYFAMAAQTKPLLHTWSLSLEWQFYIWMPLVLLLVWRWASTSRSQVFSALVVIQIVALLSLAWCLWKSQVDATGSSYFSLRARAWEPLFGGSVAAFELWRRSTWNLNVPWIENKVVAITGWAMVAISIASPIPEPRWPGLLTILPIFGAAMVVAARQGADANGVLARAPIQKIGDWSYSIYLWHWPIWVFALNWLSLRGERVNATHKLLMVSLTLMLSATSYRYVEQAVRIRREFWTPRRLIVGSSALFSLLACFIGIAFLNEGFPARLPSYLLPAELARKTNTPRDECFRNANSIKKVAETYCRFGSAETASQPSAIVWGDSFANQYLEPISAAAGAIGIHGLIATQSACRPFIDDQAQNSGDQRACRDFNKSTLAFLASHAQPSIVVLGGNWGNSIEISSLVGRLRSSDKTVVLILPLLSIGFDLPQRWIEKQVKAGRAITEWKIPAAPSLTMHDLRTKIALDLERYKDDPRVIFVDPQSVVCERNDCYLVKDGQANFRDAAHISNVNAMQFKALFDSAFQSALRAGSEPERR